MNHFSASPQAGSIYSKKTNIPLTPILRTLYELGLHEKEARIYLALLTLGTNPVSIIARKTGQNRTSCYAIIEKLIEKGFIEQMVKNNISYFSPVEPKYILGKFKSKHEELENKIEYLENIFHHFKNDSFHTSYPKIFYYEGLTSIENLFEDTLRSRDIIRAYILADELNEILPSCLSKYYQKQTQKGLALKVIYPATAKSFTRKQSDNKNLRVSKTIQPSHHFNVNILIYEDRLGFNSLKEKTTFIIQNKTLAETYKKIFDNIWETI